MGERRCPYHGVLEPCRICDEGIHKILAERDRYLDLLVLLQVDGYEQMPTEKVRAIAERGKAWEKAGARLELERRDTLRAAGRITEEGEVRGGE